MLCYRCKYCGKYIKCLEIKPDRMSLHRECANCPMYVRKARGQPNEFHCKTQPTEYTHICEDCAKQDWNPT